MSVVCTQKAIIPNNSVVPHSPLSKFGEYRRLRPTYIARIKERLSFKVALLHAIAIDDRELADWDVEQKWKHRIAKGSGTDKRNAPRLTWFERYLGRHAPEGSAVPRALLDVEEVEVVADVRDRGYSPIV